MRAHRFQITRPPSKLRRGGLVPALVLACCLGAAGCGSGGEEDVRESVRSFFAAAGEGEATGCSARLSAQPQDCLAEARKLGAPQEIEQVDAVNEIEIDGDNATARVVSVGQRLSGLVLLVKEGEEWKFDGVDESAF